MPTDREVDEAYAVLSELPGDMGELRRLGRAVLEAAERERERYKRETCTHPAKSGNGMISSDGSSKFDWYCRDCGASGHTETPPGTQLIDATFLNGLR